MEERRKPVLGRVVPGVSPDLQRRLQRFYAIVQALSPSLAARLTGTGVDRDVRAREKASDHAPVWITLAD